jgi:RNA 2',3'-cyclic 3'-phosphodiesterase
VEGHEHLRLFVALLLPDDAVAGLVDWQRNELVGRGDFRLVPPENLHITMAFLGRTPSERLLDIGQATREAAQKVEPPVLEPVRYRETRSVGMIVLSDEDGRAERLASRVFRRLERLGIYEREQRRWLPHVTVIRFRERPRLQPPPPELGRVTSSEMAVMMSRLAPTGAQYEVLESVSLGG